MIKKHIDYILDNLEDYWFKRKFCGWGWAPAIEKRSWYTRRPSGELISKSGS